MRAGVQYASVAASRLADCGPVTAGAPVTPDACWLAGFMVPTKVWFRSDPLPRNPQGKVLKRELRDELVAPGD